MWNIGNIPLVDVKWTPKELEEKPEVKSIPLWVHLKNVPMNMFSWEGLSFITSAAGHPVKLHPETTACSNFKIAKIFVNADLSKELPRKINFTKNGKSSLVEFVYPWLPDRCHTCSKWGHTEKTCLMNKKEDFPRTVTEIIETGYISKKQANTNEEEVVKDVSGTEEPHKRGVEKLILTEGDKEVAVEDDVAGKVATEEEVVVGDEAEEATAEEGEIEEGEVVKGWSRVSPGKTSRSPTATTPKYGQERIATPSRFSALNDADDNGDLVINIGESNRGETVVEEGDEGTTSEETQEGKESGKNILREEDKENTPRETAVIEDQLVSLETKSLAVGQNKGNGSNTEKEERQGTGVGGGSCLRPSLPRSSKTNHKIFSEHTNKDIDLRTQEKRSRKSSQ